MYICLAVDVLPGQKAEVVRHSGIVTDELFTSTVFTIYRVGPVDM